MLDSIPGWLNRAAQLCLVGGREAGSVRIFLTVLPFDPRPPAPVKAKPPARQGQGLLKLRGAIWRTSPRRPARRGGDPRAGRTGYPPLAFPVPHVLAHGGLPPWCFPPRRLADEGARRHVRHAAQGDYGRPRRRGEV